MVIVRYADDIVVGFEHEADGRRFLDMMRERLAECALTLHPEKTRLIMFGRFAAAEHAKLRLGKPDPARPVPNPSQKSAGPTIGEAAGDQGRTAPAHAADACSPPARAGSFFGATSPSGRIPVNDRKSTELGQSRARPARPASGSGTALLCAS
jgi:hypothetical protein